MGLLSSGACSEEEANHPWVKNPLKMEVKSVLDPCEDDNEGLQDDMSDDEMQNNDYYDTDSEVDPTQGQGDQYIVAPIEKQQEQEDNGKIDEDLFNNNKMASDLNSGLSKKTNVFGLKAWVLMVIVVGLFIIIILVVLSICLALRKKSRRGKGGMLPLGHILSISEEIKEISVDQVSSNNHPQNGSFE